MVSGHKTLGTQSFGLDLTGYAGGPLTLKVALIGASSTVRDPDHYARFELNGSAIGEATFDGLASLVVELDVPASAVVDGLNTLRVSGLLLPSQTHSFFFVDWIEAAFERELRPEAGMLHFHGTPSTPVAASGFARPVALSLVDPANPAWLAHADGSATAWLAEAEPLVLVDAARVPMLQPELAVSSAWFMDKGSRIDYLIITSRALQPTVETLADYRRGQGLRVGVASYEDISDVLGHGLRTPEVVQGLLAYAHKHWKTAPWMVLLAGNGHYDYLNTYGAGNNHVPPLLHSIRDGLFAADGLFADLTADGLPDLAIGRLPARTSAELAVMITKIQSYEQSFGAPWQETIVLAADRTDGAGAFTADSEQLASQLPPESIVDRLYLDAMSDTAAKAALISRVNAGVGFVHYTGHGGRDNLSRILRGADVSQLNNATTPSVLVALSCLAGRFEAPGVDSLGLQLMRRSGGGTVAILGPSGLSYNESAVALGEAFHAVLRDKRVGTLGVAFLRARHAATADGLGEGTRAIYNLLGDPALRIGGITGIDEDAQSFAQWRWNLLAPEELAQAGQDLTPGTGGDTGALMQYAFGVSPDRPSASRGIQSISLTPDGNVSINWSRRRLASDLRYRLLVSEDLVHWEEAPPDVETRWQGNSPDGVLENVSSRLNRQRSPRLFFRVEVRQE